MAKTMKARATKAATKAKTTAKAVETEATGFVTKAREAVEERFETVTERAKEAWASAQERAKSARENAGEALGVLRTSLETAGSGLRDMNMKVIEFVQSDANTYFDTVKKVAGAKSLKEALEIQTGYVRSQFKTNVENARTVRELVAETAKDAFKPVRDGIASLRKAA